MTAKPANKLKVQQKAIAPSLTKAVNLLDALFKAMNGMNVNGVAQN